MPDELHEFSKGAEGLIGDFRGIPFTEPPRMRRRQTTAMAPLIESLLVKYQIGRNSCEQTIRDHWAEMVGTANAAYSHPVRIDRGRSPAGPCFAQCRPQRTLHASRVDHGEGQEPARMRRGAGNQLPGRVSAALR